MTDPIQAAIEKADEACPCRRAMSGLTAAEFPASPCWRLRHKVCRCGTQEPDKPHIVCIWEGHAAIRSLAATCIEEAAKAAEEGWSMKLNNEEVPSPAAARIRALLPQSREEKP